MTERIALDTNIAIDILNEVPEAIKKLQTYDSIFLTTTVIGELLFGAKNSARSNQNLSRFRAFIDACEEITLDNPIAEAYAELRLNLKQKGKPIPENDIWIAAACMVNAVPLLTRDRHFEHIEGLAVEFLP